MIFCHALVIRSLPLRRFLPSLSALYAFDAAARHLNFTRAAEDLGITQSGISRQIRNLEEMLGLSLFERAGPKLVLTVEGAAYYEENLASSRAAGRGLDRRGPWTQDQGDAQDRLSAYLDASVGGSRDERLREGTPPVLVRDLPMRP